nr:vegetative cell wall protein gp1-like [Aegilops tauschii subsp. strangulata]
MDLHRGSKQQAPSSPSRTSPAPRLPRLRPTSRRACSTTGRRHHRPDRPPPRISDLIALFLVLLPVALVGSGPDAALSTSPTPFRFLEPTAMPCSSSVSTPSGPSPLSLARRPYPTALRAASAASCALPCPPLLPWHSLPPSTCGPAPGSAPAPPVTVPPRSAVAAATSGDVSSPARSSYGSGARSA